MRLSYFKELPDLAFQKIVQNVKIICEIVKIWRVSKIMLLELKEFTMELALLFWHF